MRHIKPYRLFESTPQAHWNRFKETFGISKEEINDLLVEIYDDFPDIDYWIDDAESSWLVEPSNQNIFVIYFDSNKHPWEKENLYDLEHFLHKGKLSQIKSYLRDCGLEVYASDFGATDTEYEIVICKKGITPHKKEEYRKRYIQNKYSDKKG